MCFCKISEFDHFTSNIFLVGGDQRSSGPRGGDSGRESYRRDGGASDKAGAGADFNPEFVSLMKLYKFRSFIRPNLDLIFHDLAMQTTFPCKPLFVAGVMLNNLFRKKHN